MIFTYHLRKYNINNKFIIRKTPIIFIKKNLSSSSTNNNLEFSSNVKMCVENLNKQGFSPIIVNEFPVWHDKLSKSKNIEIVNFLESLSK